MMEILLWLGLFVVVCLGIIFYIEGKKCPSCKQSSLVQVTAVTPLGMSTQKRYRSIMKADGSRYKEPYQVTITKYIEDRHCGSCGYKWKKTVTKVSNSDSWIL